MLELCKTLEGTVCLFVCWLLNVPATCKCISGTDLLRQFYLLPHWDRSSRSNFPFHPVTVYWHRVNQFKHWPLHARRLAGLRLECHFLSYWYDSTPEKSRRKRDSNPGSSALEADALTSRTTRRWKGRAVTVSTINLFITEDSCQSLCEAHSHIRQDPRQLAAHKTSQHDHHLTVGTVHASFTHQVQLHTMSIQRNKAISV